MSKISKLLIMALVILAVVTMSVKVNAAVSDLTDYVSNFHAINGMIFELDNSQKVAVTDYLKANVSNEQADAALAKIKEAEKLVVDSGVTNVETLSATVKSKIISLAQEAATTVGLKLEVNTANNTYNLLNGTTSLASGKVEANISTPGAGSAGSAGSSATTSYTTVGSTLLYTGANYAIYAVAILAIVAVAVVVKKRA